jgi:hypothetical protein
MEFLFIRKLVEDYGDACIAQTRGEVADSVTVIGDF